MRNLSLLNANRQAALELRMYGMRGDDTTGVFRFRSDVDNGILNVLASSGMGWDHVSVSRTDRIPTWTEMQQIKRLFFRDDEFALQYHMPESKHINVHPNCLHLWRPHAALVPFPDPLMV